MAGMMLRLVSEVCSLKLFTKIKVLIALVIVFLIVAGICFWYLFGVDLSSKVYERVVDYERIDVRLVIRARALGSGGNSEISILEYSMSDNGVGLELIVFKGVMDLYYAKKNDSTLIVYVSSEGVPKDAAVVLSKSKIEINELRSYGEIMDFDRNYRRYGLSKISAYAGE